MRGGEGCRFEGGRLLLVLVLVLLRVMRVMRSRLGAGIDVWGRVLRGECWVLYAVM